jgi:type I restriction enzyme M protein
VLFFDKRPITKRPATEELWVYDLRSGRRFSLRQNPIRADDLVDFVQNYRTDNRGKRVETASFRRFTYSEIMARDKASLDIQWRQAATIARRPATPQAAMKEILKDLDEAMREFAAAESEISSRGRAKRTLGT